MPIQARVDVYSPDYYNEDKGPLIIYVTVPMTGVAILFIVARMYSRSLSLRRLLIDDYLVIISGVRRPLLYLIRAY